MPVRCAIYTRKSHDERADSQLGSTERQRELCEAYIASQADAGWQVSPDPYEDIGYSGASLRRPALDRLLAAVAASEVDVVVVYKIDRLTRSMRDFFRLLDVLERAGVTFVSITQSFSTADAAGRLMLNVLLSFGQFERELIGERARDWKAGARQRGLWTSGPAPFGYRLRDLRLEPDPDCASVVRTIYRRFLALGTLYQVAAEVNEAGHRNRLGRAFDGRQIRAILSSRTYRGELPHRGAYSAGSHPALVTEALWRKARERLREMEARRTWRAKPGRRARPG